MDKTEFLARMRAARLAGQAGRGVGRGSAQKNRLLDDADLNIGNAAFTMPQNATGDPESIPLLNPPRILNLDALSPTGQMVTVAITAAIVVDRELFAMLNANVTAGPITAIIEFGNGGVFTRVEVDVPIGPYQANASVPGMQTQPREPQDGGTIISLPAGVLRVYGRNDARFVTPTIRGTIPAGASPPSTSDVQVLVKAFTCYQPRTVGGRLSSPRRTLYLGSGIMAGGGVSIYSIPPFAKAVRILRNPPTNTVTYTLRFHDSVSGNVLDTRIFSPATPSDFVAVPGTANNVEVIQGAGVADGFLALEFEIGV